MCSKMKWKIFIKQWTRPSNCNLSWDFIFSFFVDVCSYFIVTKHISSLLLFLREMWILYEAHAIYIVLYLLFIQFQVKCFNFKIYKRFRSFFHSVLFFLCFVLYHVTRIVLTGSSSRAVDSRSRAATSEWVQLHRITAFRLS